MKLSTIGIVTLASSVHAAPQFSIAGLLDPIVASLYEVSLSLQMGKTRPTGPDTFSLNGCTPNVLIITRGTSETGNVGTFIGGPICTSLKQKLGSSFSCQGVGGPGYPALFLDNVSVQGTCDACITSAVNTFKDVSAKCPSAKIAFLGYSQGAAIMHATIPQLSLKIQSQLVAGVLFGDTKNYQTSGTIKGFPSNKLKVFCAQDDGVCGGWLNVNPGHVSYHDRGDTERAAEWLAAKFKGS